jgi:hypothetical protein
MAIIVPRMTTASKIDYSRVTWPKRVHSHSENASCCLNVTSVAHHSLAGACITSSHVACFTQKRGPSGMYPPGPSGCYIDDSWKDVKKLVACCIKNSGVMLVALTFNWCNKKQLHNAASGQASPWESWSRWQSYSHHSPWQEDNSYLIFLREPPPSTMSTWLSLSIAVAMSRCQVLGIVAMRMWFAVGLMAQSRTPVFLLPYQLPIILKLPEQSKQQLLELTVVW